MPEVGGRDYNYSPEGVSAAVRDSLRTGKPVQMHRDPNPSNLARMQRLRDYRALRAKAGGPATRTPEARPPEVARFAEGTAMTQHLENPYGLNIDQPTFQVFQRMARNEMKKSNPLGGQENRELEKQTWITAVRNNFGWSPDKKAAAIRAIEARYPARKNPYPATGGSPGQQRKRAEAEKAEQARLAAVAERQARDAARTEQFRKFQADFAARRRPAAPAQNAAQDPNALQGVSAPLSSVLRGASPNPAPPAIANANDNARFKRDDVYTAPGTVAPVVGGPLAPPAPPAEPPPRTPTPVSPANPGDIYDPAAETWTDPVSKADADAKIAAGYTWIPGGPGHGGYWQPPQTTTPKPPPPMTTMPRQPPITDRNPPSTEKKLPPPTSLPFETEAPTYTVDPNNPFRMKMNPRPLSQVMRFRHGTKLSPKENMKKAADGVAAYIKGAKR